jgi:hypothetical protein
VEHQLPEGGNEFTLAPEGLRESFCADIPADDAAFYAISQRPLAGVALTEAAPTSAWRSRPAWAVLGTADRCIDPGVHRFSYKRMGATVTEIAGWSARRSGTTEAGHGLADGWPGVQRGQRARELDPGDAVNSGSPGIAVKDFTSSRAAA